MADYRCASCYVEIEKPTIARERVRLIGAQMGYGKFYALGPDQQAHAGDHFWCMTCLLVLIANGPPSAGIPR